MFRHPYFHTFEFNCSLVTAFFIAFVSVTCAILPAAGLYSLGAKASDALSEYADPPRNTPRPAERPPTNPVHGIPVAMTQGAQR